MRRYLPLLVVMVAAIASMAPSCGIPWPPKPSPTPTVAPTPEPTPTPTATPLPVSACPRPLAPGAEVYVNAKPWGQGQDSTIRVRGDAAFCEAVGGAGADCHLEGLPHAQRVACELEIAGGCPIWQYRIASNPQPRPCVQEASDPALSCDHFGSPPADMRDDPQTPACEAKPEQCCSQRDTMGHPKAGYFTIAHGAGEVRACKPDGTGCSAWIGVDH